MLPPSPWPHRRLHRSAAPAKTNTHHRRSIPSPSNYLLFLLSNKNNSLHLYI
uniref:Uncharacterized protein n=1 Tax=Manihot esculenta TaxID=3983 RepID=A0A2C9UVM6_MANES